MTQSLQVPSDLTTFPSKYEQGCLNERDKIYRFLGLLAKSDRVDVDYAKTVIEVYVDALMAVLTQRGQLYIGLFMEVSANLARNMGFTAEMMALVEKELEWYSGEELECDRMKSLLDTLPHCSGRLNGIALARFTQKGVYSKLYM
jgi:hypothetical protein